MHWFTDRAPETLRTYAKLVLLIAVLSTGMSVALWLYGEGGLLAVGGVAAAGALVWEFAWDRPRRKQRLAEMARAQPAPGTQSLRSEVGAPHWTDKLPQPLRAIAQTGPVALVAVAGLGVALVVAEVVADTAGDGPDVRVLLEEGAAGEIEPPFGTHSRIRVTILSIVEGPETPQPRPDRRYWAALVAVENIGTREVRGPGWGMRDSVDRYHNRVLDTAIGEDLPVPLFLDPGETDTGWVVFEIQESADVLWLRATPFDPLNYTPFHLYFDAK